jgi:MoaA/NifB/PqqE/SkfB family radical SAM enzyme
MPTFPDRLNLSIGNSCWVRCAGCYNNFGRTPPDLARVEASVSAFVQRGLRAVTISGGDPLRIPNLVPFLRRLRRAGVESIKVDTVGTALLQGATESVDLIDLLDAIDILGVPLDGWSEQSVRWFRKGRPRLFGETLELLEALEQASARCQIYVNTVLHRLNVAAAHRIFAIVSRFAIVRRWNVFQYVPTDQATPSTNERLAISDASFSTAARTITALGVDARRLEIECASARDRLGKYLLVNSDGNGWMPDAGGCTVPLGTVFGREGDAILAWREVSERVGCFVP